MGPSLLCSGGISNYLCPRKSDRCKGLDSLEGRSTAFFVIGIVAERTHNIGRKCVLSPLESSGEKDILLAVLSALTAREVAEEAEEDVLRVIIDFGASDLLPAVDVFDG